MRTTYGILMRYARIWKAYGWNMHGLNMEYVWNDGLCTECAWNMYGARNGDACVMHAYGEISEECGRNMYGISTGYTCIPPNVRFCLRVSVCIRVYFLPCVFPCVFFGTVCISVCIRVYIWLTVCISVCISLRVYFPRVYFHFVQ